MRRPTRLEVSRSALIAKLPSCGFEDEGDASSRSTEAGEVFDLDTRVDTDSLLKLGARVLPDGLGLGTRVVEDEMGLS
jgi:hypothetical protein